VEFLKHGLIAMVLLELGPHMRDNFRSLAKVPTDCQQTF
jgi:hypothetical protein